VRETRHADQNGAGAIPERVGSGTARDWGPGCAGKQLLRDVLIVCELADADREPRPRSDSRGSGRIVSYRLAAGVNLFQTPRHKFESPPSPSPSETSWLGSKSNRRTTCPPERNRPGGMQWSRRALGTKVKPDAALVTAAAGWQSNRQPPTDRPTCWCRRPDSARSRQSCAGCVA
jgi:hypothetical protein